MIIVLAEVLIREGGLEQALDLSLAHVRRSRTEPGCLSHTVSRDADDPQRLVFVERWADEAALRQHFRVPASREFVDALALLCSARPHIEIHAATPVPL